MQNKQRIIDLGLAIIVSCSAAGAAAAALDPQKFVAGWPLDATGEETFYDLPLTHEVYRFGRSLDELAVLDANREPMPFYRVAVAAPAISETRASLAVSPIYVQQKAEAGADLSISLQGDRTDVSIKRPGQEESSEEVVAFVADARGVEHLPYALEFEWLPLERPFLMNVTVEQSNDLNNWRRVGGGSIAALAIEDAPLAHRKIEIAGRPGGTGLAKAPVGLVAFADAFGEQRRIGLTRGPKAFHVRLDDAEQGGACRHRVGHGTADEIGRGAGDRQQSRRDQAAGRALGDGDGFVSGLQLLGDTFGER